MFSRLSVYILLFFCAFTINGNCTDTTYSDTSQIHFQNQDYDSVFIQVETENIEIIESQGKKGLLERRPAWFLPNINFDKPVILIYILIIVIIYSISSILIMLIFMIINRDRRNKTNHKITDLKERYQSLLVDYLEHEADNSLQLKQIKKIANSQFTRKILIDEMIDLSINLQKAKTEELRDLYYKLGLNNDSIEKINAKQWHTRIKGFKECAFMNIEEAIPIIEDRLNCKNDIERSEAQLALVRLNIENPYSFLDNLNRPFSVWEQNIVHQEITYHNLTIPEFEKWCYSKNDSIRRFSSKMIQLFDQKGSWMRLVDLLYDDDDKTRASAITSLGNINVEGAQKYLKGRYEYENDENKMLIINALTKYKNLNNIVFFKHVIEIEEKNVWLQVEAAKGIREIGDEGKNELVGLLNSEEYRNYQIVIKHVLDDRL